MTRDPRLDVDCPTCRKPFHLDPGEVVAGRTSYVCPRCGGEVTLTPEQGKLAAAQLKQRLDDEAAT